MHARLNLFVVTLIAALALVAVTALTPTASAAVRPVWSPSIDRHVTPVAARRFGQVLTTWYGPGFFGRRTGCGSVLRTRTWGIAHRTLPCGTLVWLRYRGRQLAVPVIDRGPYGRASVDLTWRTAVALRFRGIDHVRMVALQRRVPRRRW